MSSGLFLAWLDVADLPNWAVDEAAPQYYRTGMAGVGPTCGADGRGSAGRDTRAETV